jgi:hypothetical protein
MFDCENKKVKEKEEKCINGNEWIGNWHGGEKGRRIYTEQETQLV